MQPTGWQGARQEDLKKALNGQVYQADTEEAWGKSSENKMQTGQAPVSEQIDTTVIRKTGRWAVEAQQVQVQCIMTVRTDCYHDGRYT